MQPFPRHWATIHESRTFPGLGTFALTLHGSSDVSVEDAQRDARERLERLVAAGGPRLRPGDRRSGKDPRSQNAARAVEYYPLRRLPEELLDELHGEEGTLLAAITRNRYGAAVLNTDALLICDVDLPPESRRSARRAAERTGATARKRPGLLARLFGGKAGDGAAGSSDAGSAASAAGAAGAAGAVGAAGAPGGGGTSEAADGVVEDPDLHGLQGEGARGEAHARILDSARAFAQRHPDLGVRIYRTRAGFRLLISGSGAAPASEGARALMEEVSGDRLYIRLCRVHDSYRARLTPKPWRVGMARFEDLGTRTSADPSHGGWVESYREKSQAVAVCRLLEVAGPTPSADEQAIIALHDRATRPESGLPLA